MKRLVSIFLLFLAFLVTAPSWAESRVGVYPYERAGNESMFDRMSDWFATAGKPENEKERIIAERRIERSAKQAKREWERREKIVAKKMKAFNKEMEKAFK